MYADTLLAAERFHLLRIAGWGIMSVLVGVALVLLASRPAARSPLLKHFGIQNAAWGAIDLAIVAWSWRGLKLRDYGGAVSLDRFLWFNAGLDVGYVMAGITLAACGWAMGRRLGAVGAGIGIVVQGLALLVFELILLQTIVR